MFLNQFLRSTAIRIGLPVILAIGLPVAVSARGGGQAPVPDIMENQLAVVLLVIMFILLLAILLLSHVLRGAADIYRQKMEKEREEKKAGVPAAAITLLLLGFSTAVSAQAGTPSAEASVAVAAPSLPALTFYVMVGVIALELLIIFVMLQQLKTLIGIRSKPRRAFRPVNILLPVKNLWAKMNSFKPVEQEADLELGHNYDGISELDNRLPPWWLYGFYATILFAGIYLYRYHISGTGLSQTEEYAIAMKHAEEQKAEYLKKAANQVDENTVTMLAAASDLAAGKGIFESTCTPCHGKAGEGVVGPNLTDNYWLHGGSIKDVFKTIKYGVPEKGMRSWKDDFSPVQLAQLSSYIKSIHGTNPPNAKEQQGQEYKEQEDISKDSTARPNNSVAGN